MIKTWLETVPENADLKIDTSRADFIDKDVIEEINNFMVHAYLKNIGAIIFKNDKKLLHTMLQELVVPKEEVLLD